MSETGTKNIDELLVDRGPAHVGRFAEINRKLREGFDEEKRGTLFGDKVTQELDSFLDSSPSWAYEGFRKFYCELKALESTKAPGHDFAHLTDTLSSAVRITEQYPDLSEAVKLEVMVACLMHDLGRFTEHALEGPELDKKSLELLAPLFVGRGIQKKLGQLPTNFGDRVLYDIASASEAKTGIISSDIVHQSDREQLIGTPVIFRELAFDVGLEGREIAIPFIAEFRNKLPTPESENDRYMLVQCEFYMRNVYPPVSPDGEAVINEIKKENAVILLLALEGKSHEYLEQVFGPELGLVNQGEEGVHWSKKPIPVEVFEQARKEEREFLEVIDKMGLEYDPDLDNLVNFSKRAIETDKVVMPENFEEVLRSKLQNCDEQERRNYWTILVYTLIQRHKKRRADIQAFEDLAGQRSFTGEVSKILKDEFTQREDIFRRNFPSLV